MTYTEDYKRKMNAYFEIKNKNPVPASIHQPIQKKQEIKPKKSFLGLVISLIVLVALYILSLVIFMLDKSYSLFAIALFSLITGFLILFIVYKLYEKILLKTKNTVILTIVYLLLILNMFLANNYYSIEWAFIAFIAAGMIFYDSKTDSRFFILFALILLGFVPFLLISKLDKIAETIAIYVYYSLIIGVALQIIEHTKNLKNRLDFDDWIKRFINNLYWNRITLLIGIISIVIIVYSRIVQEINFLKMTSIYLFILSLIFYILSEIKEKQTKI